MKLRWEEKYQSTSTATVPDKPGLYAYGTIEDVCGLEKARTIVYVGRSDNLHRRLSQHQPNEERNRPLQRFLREESGIICWYCPLDLSTNAIKDLEKQMIQSLSPKFNTQHNLNLSRNRRNDDD